MTSSEEKTSDSGQKGSLLRHFRLPSRYPLLSIALALTIGIIVGAPLLDYTDKFFSSDTFCATGCHVMEATVTQELHQSSHWKRKSGVRASCGDCHISEDLLPAMIDHIFGLSDLYAFTIRGIRSPEEFEKIRAASAKRVRLEMVLNGSKNCRKCHIEDAIQPERRRGQKQHREAQEANISCIACHYNLVHKEVAPSKAFLEATSE